MTTAEKETTRRHCDARFSTEQGAFGQTGAPELGRRIWRVHFSCVLAGMQSSRINILSFSLRRRDDPAPPRTEAALRSFAQLEQEPEGCADSFQMLAFVNNG
eukprot:424664-Rhodomonas_salina.2